MTTETVSKKDRQLLKLIQMKFRTFGGGDNCVGWNPIANALQDAPLQFAAGVDVKEVVDFIREFDSKNTDSI